ATWREQGHYLLTAPLPNPLPCGERELLVRKQPEHRFLGVANQCLQSLTRDDQLRTTAGQAIRQEARIAQELNMSTARRLREHEMVRDLVPRRRVLREPEQDA